MTILSRFIVETMHKMTGKRYEALEGALETLPREVVNDLVRLMQDLELAKKQALRRATKDL